MVIQSQSTSKLPVLQNITQVSDGWIKKYVLSYLMPDGSLYDYESVSRKNMQDYAKELARTETGDKQTPDALCIVPRTTNDELILIKEFRYPLNSWCIAFPAGLIEPGENLVDCLERELKEETGYKLHLIEGETRIHSLSQAGYSSTGMAEENVQIVYALVEEGGQAEPDPSEFIEVFLLPLAEVREFLRENELPIGTRCQLILESFARDSKREALCRPDHYPIEKHRP